MHSIILILVNVIDQSACSDNLLHERRERRSLEGLAGGFISDHAGVKVDGNHIALVDGLAGGGAFQNGQADVDGVAVEDTGKALGNHAVNAGGLDGNGGMLAGRTAAEVFIRNNDIAGLYVFDEILVNILHAVLCKLCRIGGI